MTILYSRRKFLAEPFCHRNGAQSQSESYLQRQIKLVGGPWRVGLLIRRSRRLPMGPVHFRGPLKRVLLSVSDPKTSYRAPRTRLPRGLHVG
ncbi:hypothetical protein NPIL_355411 [Nephila pilipes]|uniref:Uncharacterized protein n=1 Tax=Nephila pilipes TaxID=299642 RepID=A0A8X6QVU4_NEPPI|nr:hypothetical protein NPIL_355411 [Nephila pilipes]